MRRRRNNPLPSAEPATTESLTIIDQIAARKRALSLQEFADLYDISYKTVFDMAKKGDLPSTKVGGQYRLDPKTTVDWLRARTTAA